ncbi:hypothetical protein CPT_Metamorpho_187 [Klebsiella phage Metamorpho]|nr:hypothetical protein CPT_Metamorpho_187 [Klebsiella phage Metamorpho]
MDSYYTQYYFHCLLNMKKFVMCYRCLHVYDYNTAPKTATKRLKTKEPECPKCKCKVIYS